MLLGEHGARRPCAQEEQRRASDEEDEGDHPCWCISLVVCEYMVCGDAARAVGRVLWLETEALESD